MTTPAVLKARVQEQPDHEVLHLDDGVLTYAELDARSNQLANSLAELGLRKGDKAAILLENGREFLFTWHALAKSGVVEVPINTAFKGDLLAYVLDQADSSALILDSSFLERVLEVTDRLPKLRNLVVVGSRRSTASRLQVLSFRDLLTAGSEREPAVEVLPSDLSAIIFTSGTTGPSKGVMLSHRHNVRLAQSVIEFPGFGPDDVFFTAFPLFHVAARYVTVLPAMVAGGRAVLHRHFSASRFWDVCRAEGVTGFNYLGSILMMLYKQPERPDDADNPVRKAWGAGADVLFWADFERRFGLRLHELFGLTETGIATINTDADFRMGSCGREVPFWEVRVVDEDDEPLPPGEVGEIVLRPKQPDILFSGWYRMPNETLRAFRNLWFHSGDRGHIDEDGYLYFGGRLKDSIRRRGENISAWEVEKVIDSHSAVAESAVIGVPAELGEEEVLAVVVLKPGQGVRPEQLLEHCQTLLPFFAVPRYVRVVDVLPKTPSQRVEKFKLKGEGLAPGTWDREAGGFEVRK